MHANGKARWLLIFVTGIGTCADFLRNERREGFPVARPDAHDLERFMFDRLTLRAATDDRRVCHNLGLRSS